MEELKLKLNYLREIGFGLQSGYCQDTTNTESGLQADKSISCKAEETLAILENSEEDLKLSVQLFTGDQTTSLTSTLRRMLKRASVQAAMLMISTLSVFIGMINSSTLMLMMTATES